MAYIEDRMAPAEIERRREFRQKAAQALADRSSSSEPPLVDESARAAQDLAYQNRVNKAAEEEAKRRNKFRLNGANQVGAPFFSAMQREFKPEPLDPDEFYGDAPYVEGGIAQIVFKKDELDPPGPKILTIRESVAAHNLKHADNPDMQKRLVVIGYTPTLDPIAVVGTLDVLYHYTEENPAADITRHYFKPQNPATEIEPKP